MSRAATVKPPGRSLPEEKLSMRLAAIDVGSNSIHMVVAQADADDAITTLWRLKEMVGLGRLSFPSKRLTKDAINRAVSTLARFKQAAEQRQCEKVITVATSAVREAENGGELLEAAREQLRMDVRVVSAREEARLIYLAVRHTMPMGKDNHLIMDIGGGSVEFIVGDEHRSQLLESRKLGAARVTARFVKSDPINEHDQNAIRKHYQDELGPLFDEIVKLKPAGIIGTSGTLENIAAMCAARHEGNGHSNGRSIERNDFDKVFQQLLSSTTEGRAHIKGLDDQRKDQIIAGMILVSEVFERLKVRRIQLCNAALREGIVLDYLQRHAPDMSIRRELPDPRRRSVYDLARKCAWHRTHSEHVTHLCLRLYDELKSVHRLGNAEKELIEYGSLLHDIGWHVSGDKHHKHGMYLIENGRLKNFSTDEVKIIANIARYHRKGTPSKKHDSYSELSKSSRYVVDVGSALLRLADGLDRSHASMIQDIRCRISKKKIEILLTARGDAALEVWGAQRKAEWFEDVLDRKLELTVVGASGRNSTRA